MIKVSGYSDDLVCIEDESTLVSTVFGLRPLLLKEVDCFEKDVVIKFSDGTCCKVHYGKRVDNKILGVWAIKITKKGTAQYSLVECFDENAEVYSDVLRIDAELKSVGKVRCKQ